MFFKSIVNQNWCLVSHLYALIICMHASVFVFQEMKVGIFLALKNSIKSYKSDINNKLDKVITVKHTK